MPLKDYKCIDCGAVVEYLIRSDADVPTRCETCGSDKIELLVSSHGGISGNFGTVPKSNMGSYKK